MITLSMMPVPALVLLSVWGWLAPFLTPASREAKAGERSYREERYQDAVDHLSAARGKGGDARVDYDLGAAAYRNRSYPAAAEAFEAAGHGSSLPPGAAAYNLGNARYRAGDKAGALEAWREALRLDPGNSDARYNYELTRKELAGNPQQQNQQQQQDKQNQSGGDESKNRRQQGQAGADSTGDGQNRSPADRSGKKPQPSPGDEQQQPPEENQDQNPGAAQADSLAQAPADSTRRGGSGQPGRLLTPEQAAQLLDQITPEERELLEARLKSARRRHVEKDW